jgi:hypothetical protein
MKVGAGPSTRTQVRSAPRQRSAARPLALCGKAQVTRALHCGMTPQDEHLLPDELDARAERASFSSARHHVGEAGLIQLDRLEQIIHAGREQIVVTQALRQVVTATLKQLHATPLGQPGALTHEHRANLEGIVQSGCAQIEIAHQLRLTIQQTLAQIRETPLEHVSGHLLSTLSETVYRQVQDLEDIIGAAVGQAGSLEQIAGLERVGTQAAARLQQMEQDRDEHELVTLERETVETLGRIRELERIGQSQAERKSQLLAEKQTAEARIAALQQASAQDQAETGPEKEQP